MHFGCLIWNASKNREMEERKREEEREKQEGEAGGGC